MAKQKLTKTTNPIHFEDLEPHRFEDLVRQLIYDLKDWATIEATGKGGSDDGYDVRAFEKAPKSDEDEDTSTLEGNLWMIQCKREQTLGPKRVAEIIEESIGEEVPYGFILAASTNFSKKSYDVFREKLREKGVMEFYIWGRPELEDMLYLPKNDRILFTFFGVSFVSKRKSRATEIRAVVNIKNKLQKLFVGRRGIGENVLVRDIKDTHYPYDSEYPDFKEKPKWKEFFVASHHPLGLILTKRRYFCYVDSKKKEMDFYSFDTLPRKEKINNPPEEIEKHLRDFHDMLPEANKATLVVNGLIRYEDIVVVDDQGDSEYKMPHIYVDFQGNRGPFSGGYEYFENEHQSFGVKPSECKRVSIFPEKIEPLKWGKRHKDIITVPSGVYSNLKHRIHYSPFLYLPETTEYNPFDVIEIQSEADSREKEYFQIKTISIKKVSDALKRYSEHEQQYMLQQINGTCNNPDKKTLILEMELRKVYSFDIHDQCNDQSFED